VARAREYIARYDRLPLSDELRSAGRYSRRNATAQLSLAEGDHDRAFGELRRIGEETSCTPCVHLVLGLAFEHAAMPDSAIAHLESYLTAPWMFRLDLDSRNRVRVHERLAALYSANGNTEREIYHLARFSELWVDADAELQPRVEAARRRIAALRRGGG
jgi:hypothetical protein